MTADITAKALPPLYHINAIVADVEKTTSLLTALFGIGPWQISDHSHTQEQMLVSGPGSLRAAGAWLGATMLELIQPVEGETIWAECLRKYGEGLHHIAFSVTNWDELAGDLRKRGGRMIMGIAGVGGRRSTYWELWPGSPVVELEERLAGTMSILTPPKATMKQPELHHVSLAVKDVDSTARFFSSLWGFGPWKTLEQRLEKDRTELVAGTPCRIKVASTNMEPTVLELIQPVSGASFWSRTIEVRGESVNHIAFTVANWQEMTDRIEQSGGHMIAGAVSDGGRWGYFVTTPGGIVFELKEKMG